MFARLYKAASFSEIPEICEIRVRKPITRNLLPNYLLSITCNLLPTARLLDAAAHTPHP